jgi:hypothetical protein
MKVWYLCIFVLCLLSVNCGLSGGGPGDEDYPGTWRGEGIWVEHLGDCDIDVILTETNYEVYLYISNTDILLIGSNKGTHTGLTEASETTDVWNTLTLTHEYDGNNWQETAGDEEYTSFWIEGSTMHFKYDIDGDHGAIDAEGDLLKQ